MPSSGSGRLISGSWTVARAAWTASSAGEPVSVSDIVASVSLDGNPPPAVGPRRRRPARSGHPPLYGGLHRGAGGGGGAGAHGGSGPPATVRRAAPGAVRERVIRDARLRS